MDNNPSPRVRHAILFFWITGFLLIVAWKNIVEIKRQANLSQILTQETRPNQLETPTKSSDCQVNGALPDKNCTPGAVFTDKTITDICKSGYTKTVLNVPKSLKDQIYNSYDLSSSQPRGSFEVDHLIPLAIGGNNDVANLWPEAANPQPGFKEKDIVEIYLQEEVCAGRVDLSAAQIKIADDWTQIYKNLSPERIKTLRSKYSNWAN